MTLKTLFRREGCILVILVVEAVPTWSSAMTPAPTRALLRVPHRTWMCPDGLELACFTGCVSELLCLFILSWPLSYSLSCFTFQHGSGHTQFYSEFQLQFVPGRANGQVDTPGEVTSPLASTSSVVFKEWLTTYVPCFCDHVKMYPSVMFS